MSKIGKININIPEKTKVALTGNVINVEGPLGKKNISIDIDVFDCDIKEGKEISIKPKKINDDTKRNAQFSRFFKAHTSNKGSGSYVWGCRFIYSSWFNEERGL